MIAYISLGSNLADPKTQVASAIQRLRAINATTLKRQSHLYQSAPVGILNQPDFINAVVALETNLTPHALLDSLQAIEQQHHRKRTSTKRWGPRTLDLDILMFSDQIIQDARLTIPHPEMLKRNFVLYPLAEINAELKIPEQGCLSQWLKNVPPQGLIRLPASCN